MAKKEEKQIFEYGSLHNSAVRLYADKSWYKIKRNGDVVMLTKVGVTSRIKVRLVQ